MGIFTLNIKALVPSYTGVNNVIVEENCTTRTLTHNIGITNNIVSATKKYLIANYNGLTWKNLHISNINYSDVDSFYLDYFSTTLPQAGGVVIDISTYIINDVISNFNIISNINRGELSSKSISFSLSIEDIDGLIYPPIAIDIEEAIINCSTPLEPEVTGLSTVASTECFNTGSTQTYFSVTSSIGENVNFKYDVISNGNHGFIGGLYRLTSGGGAIDHTVSNFGNSEGIIYNLIDNMGASYIAYYMTYICARPNLIAGEPNSCALQLDLRNNTNTTIIQSFNLTDSNSDF